MSSFLVFNHHSLPFQSKETACAAIPEFLKICIRARNFGISTLLIDDSVDRNWFRLKLSDNYFWQDWYNQNNNDQNKDSIRVFRSIQTRQPFFSAEDIGDELDLFEVKLKGGDTYSALRAANWHEAPLTSFPTRKPWDSSPIIVEVNEIEKDAELISNDSEIINLYSLAILKDIEPLLLQKQQASLLSGKALLESKDKVFPFIKFCGKSEQQLLNWSHSKTILEQVKESLIALNAFCEKWQTNEYQIYSHENLKANGLNHKVSGESQSILQDKILRSQREFYLPNGRKELFENHIKMAKGFRIHFFPDSITKTIYIGYIGTHLRLK
jgi:hypothetical protein